MGASPSCCRQGMGTEAEIRAGSTGQWLDFCPRPKECWQAACWRCAGRCESPQLLWSRTPRWGAPFLVLCSSGSSLIPPAPGLFSQRSFNKSYNNNNKKKNLLLASAFLLYWWGCPDSENGEKREEGVGEGAQAEGRALRLDGAMGQEIQEAGPGEGEAAPQTCCVSSGGCEQEPPAEEGALVSDFGHPQGGALFLTQRCHMNWVELHHTHPCPEQQKGSQDFHSRLLWLLAWSLDDWKAISLSPMPGEWSVPGCLEMSFWRWPRGGTPVPECSNDPR